LSKKKNRKTRALALAGAVPIATMSAQPSIRELELAIETLLSATMAWRARRQPPGRLAAATPADTLLLNRALHEVGALLAERLASIEELEDAATRIAAADLSMPGLGGRRYAVLSSAFEGLVRNGAPWVG
jgi:hypothetical protein